MSVRSVNAYVPQTTREELQQVLLEVVRGGVSLLGLTYNFDTQQWPVPDSVVIVPSPMSQVGLLNILRANNVSEGLTSILQVSGITQSTNNRIYSALRSTGYNTASFSAFDGSTFYLAWPTQGAQAIVEAALSQTSASGETRSTPPDGVPPGLFSPTAPGTGNPPTSVPPGTFLPTAPGTGNPPTGVPPGLFSPTAPNPPGSIPAGTLPGQSGRSVFSRTNI